MAIALILSLLATIALPVAVDNSVNRHFPDIIDQQGGSCAQASGIGYMFTYEINRLLDRDGKDKNNQFSYLFSWNMLNDGIDQGGFVEEGIGIAIKYGIMTAADYGAAYVGYRFGWPSGYDKYLNATRYRARRKIEFDASTPEGIEELKQYLYGDGTRPGGVVTFSAQSVGWKMDNDYDGPSATGYKSIMLRVANDGSHAMTIVGYDDMVACTDADGHECHGAFIVVNSWGRYSHDNGHYYLPYDFLLHPEWMPSTLSLSPKMTGVEVYTTEPLLSYRVKLDYTSRNDLRIFYGTSSKRDATQPERSQGIGIMYNQGGDYPMQGAFTASSELEFAIDATEMAAKGNAQRMFLNVHRMKWGKTKGEGRLLEFSVIDKRSGKTRIFKHDMPTGGVELQTSNNWFSIPVAPRCVTSASSIQNTGSPYAFVLRKANGKLVKLIAVKGNDGKMKWRYGRF